MKKFFGMLLVAVSALVLLPGCGGGGNNKEHYMTATEFATAIKYFVLGNGTNNTLYVYAAQGSGDVEGDPKVMQTFNGEGYSKASSSGASLPLSIARYTVYYDEEGIPTTATLSLNYDSSVDSDQKTQDFYNGAQLVDGEAAEFGPVNIHMDFSTLKWNMVGQQAEGDDPINVGGDFDVRVGLP